MVVKINNKDEKFYSIMGKFFGSRLIEKITNDRIYDDKNKQWYVYINEDENENALAFVSVSNETIKNIYASNEKVLEEILNYIKEEVKIIDSIVTNVYEDVYTKCQFNVNKSEGYRNFVTISM